MLTIGHISDPDYVTVQFRSVAGEKSWQRLLLAAGEGGVERGGNQVDEDVDEDYGDEVEDYGDKDGDGD